MGFVCFRGVVLRYCVFVVWCDFGFEVGLPALFWDLGNLFVNFVFWVVV